MISEKKLIEWLEERMTALYDWEDGEKWAYSNILDAVKNKEFEEEKK